MSDYQSPYGFGPITDAVLDGIADRRGMTSDEMAELCGKLDAEQLSYWVEDEWWRDYMGPAIDKLEDHLSAFLPEEDE